MSPIGVRLQIEDHHVVLDNGIVQVRLSNPEGMVTGIRYNGLDNVLEVRNDETDRGYWDVVWSALDGSGRTGVFEVIKSTSFKVIVESEELVEVSFSRPWDPSLKGKFVPLNIDKRFILLRGCSGFYTYAIYEHMGSQEWQAFSLGETRVAFKLTKDKFRYMVVADDRRRYMPLPDDRQSERGQPLAYPEAVLLVNPVEPEFKGEVDDKYQYTCENRNLKVHGWISNDPSIGFWQITPSDEFRTGGPLKQNLCSHVGPTCLAVFVGAHYAGDDLVPKFGQGEPWKKVFGPVFIYLNSVLDGQDPLTLWDDAKRQCVFHRLGDTPGNVSCGIYRQTLNGHTNLRVSSLPNVLALSPKDSNVAYFYVFQMVGGTLTLSVHMASEWSMFTTGKPKMTVETSGWPYSFAASEDFPKSNQRGMVYGKLLVRDRFVDTNDMLINGAYVGLAPPGEVGSWQRECKDYQFWTTTDENGVFVINNIRAGNYNLYAWVNGFIGDYRNESSITITPGCNINLGTLVYEPPRNGPTLWEIGVPDRSAAEFYVPDPNPQFVNKLFLDQPQNKFRQYGLWERYGELYPQGDLIYTVGESDYSKDWFYAQVPRKKEDNSYEGTTWQIKFKLENVKPNASYKLRIALAGASLAELQVRINDRNKPRPLFTTGLIGRDNAIPRHGIHGLYWLYNVDVAGSLLLEGDNTFYFTQTRSQSPFQAIMYDYIRLEGPNTESIV